MKHLNNTDKFRRKKYMKIEIERLRLKIFSYNRILSPRLRYYFIIKFRNKLYNDSKMKIKNRCLITGRAQSVYKFFHLNRSVIKEFLASNFLFGVKKASW